MKRGGVEQNLDHIHENITVPGFINPGSLLGDTSITNDFHFLFSFSTSLCALQYKHLIFLCCGAHGTLRMLSTYFDIPSCQLPERIALWPSLKILNYFISIVDNFHIIMTVSARPLQNLERQVLNNLVSKLFAGKQFLVPS